MVKEGLVRQGDVGREKQPREVLSKGKRGARANPQTSKKWDQEARGDDYELIKMIILTGKSNLRGQLPWENGSKKGVNS